MFLIIGCISLIVSMVLKGVQQRQVKQLAKYLRKGKSVTVRVTAKKNLTKSFKVLGARITFAISLSSVFSSPIIANILDHIWRN